MEASTQSLAVVTTYRELVSPILFDRLVGRVVKDESIERCLAEEIMEEALGFLKMSADNPGQHFSPSPLVDIGWHTFILYTRDYAEFCNRVAGRFLHHEPNDNPMADRVAGGLQRTIDFMSANGLPYNALLWTGKLTDGELRTVVADSCYGQAPGGPGGPNPKCSVDCDDGNCHTPG